jgi:hypothetical protein
MAQRRLQGSPTTGRRCGSRQTVGCGDIRRGTGRPSRGRWRRCLRVQRQTREIRGLGLIGRYVRRESLPVDGHWRPAVDRQRRCRRRFGWNRYLRSRGPRLDRGGRFGLVSRPRGWCAPVCHFGRDLDGRRTEGALHDQVCPFGLHTKGVAAISTCDLNSHEWVASPGRPCIEGRYRGPVSRDLTGNRVGRPALRSAYNSCRPHNRQTCADLVAEKGPCWRFGKAPAAACSLA